MQCWKRGVSAQLPLVSTSKGMGTDCASPNSVAICKKVLHIVVNPLYTLYSVDEVV